MCLYVIFFGSQHKTKNLFPRSHVRRQLDRDRLRHVLGLCAHHRSTSGNCWTGPAALPVLLRASRRRGASGAVGAASRVRLRPRAARSHLEHDPLPRHDLHAAGLHAAGLLPPHESARGGDRRGEPEGQPSRAVRGSRRPVAVCAESDARDGAAADSVGVERQEASDFFLLFFDFFLISQRDCRVCVIRSVDRHPVTSFLVHECEGSSRMASRRYLFTGHANGAVQVWDLTTALDGVSKEMKGQCTLPSYFVYAFVLLCEKRK